MLTYRFDRDIAGVDYGNFMYIKTVCFWGEDEYGRNIQDRTVTVTIADGLQYATDYEIVFDNTNESVTGESVRILTYSSLRPKITQMLFYWQRLLMQTAL